MQVIKYKSIIKGLYKAYTLILCIIKFHSMKTFTFSWYTWSSITSVWQESITEDKKSNSANKSNAPRCVLSALYYPNITQHSFELCFSIEIKQAA